MPPTSVAGAIINLMSSWWHSPISITMKTSAFSNKKKTTNLPNFVAHEATTTTTKRMPPHLTANTSNNIHSARNVWVPHETKKFIFKYAEFVYNESDLCDFMYLCMCLPFENAVYYISIAFFLSFSSHWFLAAWRGFCSGNFRSPNQKNVIPLLPHTHTHLNMNFINVYVAGIYLFMFDIARISHRPMSGWLVYSIMIWCNRRVPLTARRTIEG